VNWGTGKILSKSCFVNEIQEELQKASGSKIMIVCIKAHKKGG
jgi:hypothetical protein